MRFHTTVASGFLMARRGRLANEVSVEAQIEMEHVSGTFVNVTFRAARIGLQVQGFSPPVSL
jgi:hypothetical protein